MLLLYLVVVGLFVSLVVFLISRSRTLAVEMEILSDSNHETKGPDRVALNLKTPAVENSDESLGDLYKKLLPIRFAVVDLETTGLSATRHEIIEFGAIVVDLSSNAARGHWQLVKPRRKIPDHITEITGITQNMVESEGIPLSHALPPFLEFIGELPIVAFNASFDMAFLREASDECGIPIKNRYTCALRLAQQVWPELKSHKLSDLGEKMHVRLQAEGPSGQESQAHRSLGDCQRALSVFLSAVAEPGAKPRWIPANEPKAICACQEESVNSSANGKRSYKHRAGLIGSHQGALHGEVVVFTGALSVSRDEAAKLAASIGCDVDVSVTNRTTLLVVGDQDLDRLAGKKKSSKHLKVERLIEDGHAIKVLSESDFRGMVEACEFPSIDEIHGQPPQN